MCMHSQQPFYCSDDSTITLTNMKRHFNNNNNNNNTNDGDGDADIKKVPQTSSSSSSSSFDETLLLPNEIIQQILLCSHHVTLQDIFNSCSLVCKRWYSIINSDGFLLRLIQIELNLAINSHDLAAKLRHILHNGNLFCNGVLLNGFSHVSVNNEIMAINREITGGCFDSIRINTCQSFIEALKNYLPDDEKAKWLSQSHCYLNGGFCNHSWFWLVNFQMVTDNFPQLVSVLRMPFSIGNDNFRIPRGSNNQILLLDENLNLLETYSANNNDEGGFWLIRDYEPGVAYMVFEICDEFSTNPHLNLPLRFLWPSQIARFEQKMFLSSMSRRYGTRPSGSRRSNFTYYPHNSNNDSDCHSLSNDDDDDDDFHGDDDDDSETNNYFGIKKHRPVDEFRRCFQRQSSSESSTTDSESFFVK